MFMMCGGAVLWSWCEQRVVALTRAEAEFESLSSRTKEFSWLRRLWRGIENSFKFETKNALKSMKETNTVYYDN